MKKLPLKADEEEFHYRLTVERYTDERGFEELLAIETQDLTDIREALDDVEGFVADWPKVEAELGMWSQD